MSIPGKLYKDYVHFNDILLKYLFLYAFQHFVNISKKWEPKVKRLHVMKEYSNMLQYMSYHSAPFCKDQILVLTSPARLHESYPPPHPFFDNLGFFFYSFASFCHTVEQFGIRRWKVNEKTNLMISTNLKIGRLQLQ